ncbi:MAG: hypothetical protein NZ873_00270 [Crenarchaeota archaeon]|nr:hypothetical protein [Thermoproteota archaeon]MDW8033491.1 hypothetical protein [Nitrososphaerota archaeon]
MSHFPIGSYSCFFFVVEKLLLEIIKRYGNKSEKFNRKKIRRGLLFVRIRKIPVRIDLNLAQCFLKHYSLPYGNDELAGEYCSVGINRDRIKYLLS